MSRWLFLAAAVSLSAACIGSATAQVIEPQCGPESIGFRAFPDRIVGAWKLIDLYEEDEASDDLAMFGTDPQGQFIATESGQFSFLLFSGEGRRFSPRTTASRVETGGIMEAITYYGTYTLQEGTLTLRIIHCLFKSCDKSTRTASVSFVNDSLVFTSAVLDSLTGSFYSRLVWQRVDIVGAR